MKQYLVTTAAGKRLIAKAAARHPAVEAALNRGTVVIIAGTTNGYVAEEILAETGQLSGFSRRRFFRGITLPAAGARGGSGRLPEQGDFPGDVVIVHGKWEQGKTIFDVAETLGEGDVILKGANNVDLTRKQAGILIGHPAAGTIGAALPVVVGKRVRLIVPVGLEKRVSTDLHALAAKLNVPGAQGPRLLPVPGEVLTEIEAVSMLTGADAELTAAGGVCGAEGAVWLAVSGTDAQEAAADTLLDAVTGEPLFAL